MLPRKLWSLLVVCLVAGMLLSACAPAPVAPQTVEVEKVVTQVVEQKVTQLVTVEKMITPTAAPQKTAKYVFLFIGDGMGVAQRNAAELYLGASDGKENRPEDVKLLMNTFPAQGMNTTYDLSSVIPDSASTATAIASGFKTKSGVIGMDASGKEKYELITEVARKSGLKIGIVTTVSLDHATPAAFYAHEASRKNMYNISMQLANSGFDYFAGGQMLKPTAEGKPSAIDTAKTNGYTIATNRKEFEALKADAGKVIATNDTVDADAAMYYTIDQNKDYVTLAEYVQKGIDLLSNANDKGFFMMVEGGKIDWACHANDAASSIHDTLALDEAVKKAYDFYEKHPDETLIVVTGDHETGGMTIGFAGTQYASFVDKIQNQKMSYIIFDQKLEEYKKSHTTANARLEDLMPDIKDAFGLFEMEAAKRTELEAKVADGKKEGASDDAKKAAKAAEMELKYSMALTNLEMEVVKEAFDRSIAGEEEKAPDEHIYLLYGGYEPLTVKLTTILNQKAGISWTTYSHSGVPVQTSAIGVGAEQFNGYYDQTEIHTKLMVSSGLKK